MATPTTAREIRTFTRSAAAQKESTRERQGFGDFYSYGLLAVLAIIELIGFISAPGRMKGTLGAVATASSTPVGDPAIALLLFALFCWLYTIARSVGPVVISRAQVSWWLPLPIARRGLVLPGFVFSVCSAVLLLAVGAIVVVIGSVAGGFGTFTAASGAATVLAVAALGAVVFGIAALVQLRDRPTRTADATVRWLVPVALVIVVVAQLLAAVTRSAVVSLGWAAWLPTGWPIAVASGVLWPAYVLLGIALVVLLVVVLRLPRLSSNSLRSSAAMMGHVSTSLLSMRGLSLEPRANSSRARGRGAIRRPSIVGPSIVRPRAVSPSGRYIVTQARVWLRMPGRVAGLVTSALMPVVLIAIPSANLRAVLLIALLICAFRAASSATAVVRVVADAPQLERLFALSDAQQRRLLLVVPAALTLLWCSGCFCLIALVGAAPAWWALLALPVGLGLGGASVRCGFRPAPDWSAPSISTPAGALPSGWIYSAMYGRAALILVLLPAGIALAIGQLTPVTIIVQVVVSLAVMWWGTRVPSEIGMLKSLNPWSA